jgi:hypothetical protein
MSRVTCNLHFTGPEARDYDHGFLLMNSSARPDIRSDLVEYFGNEFYFFITF